MRDLKHSELFNQMLQKQLNNVPQDKKLKYADLKRLCKYLSTSIFDENVCSIWKGYVTNTNNISKGVYINFFFNGKKSALHRLLYINFIGPLSDNEYLKFSCEHKGKCCCIGHLKKFSYVQKPSQVKEVIKKPVETVKNNKNNSKTFLLSFD